MPATDDWARRNKARLPIVKVEAKPPEWYDAAIALPASPHMLPNPESPWIDLYRAAALLLAGNTTPPDVVDVGCGTGRFAALIDPARGTTRRYTGLDFSTAMLAEARRYTLERHDHTRCIFHRFDARDAASCKVHLSDPDAVYVLLEILEHLDHDTQLLRALPEGARVILSVPTADSESHVRRFPTVESVHKRYSSHIKLETWRRIETRNPPEYWHLLTATAKGSHA